MVKGRLYEPWSSGNVRHLQGLEKQRDVVFREPVRKPTAGEIESKKYRRNENVVQDRASIEGRPHQEEAFLIYERGQVNTGADVCAKCRDRKGKFDLCVSLGELHNNSCANCVFQSATNGCDCAVASINAQSAAKLAINEAKLNQKKARGKVSSKKRRRDPTSDDEDPGASVGETGPSRPTKAAKGSSGGRGGGGKSGGGRGASAAAGTRTRH